MRKEIWEKCVEFHGHECPGLAIGFRAAEVASDQLGLDFSQDEEVICITENDACGVDAVQVITGCTMGKGNLLFKDRGKMAFSFISREKNEGIRLYLKDWSGDMTREDRQRQILEAPVEDVFKLEKLDLGPPEEARIFSTLICEKCNEGAAENKIRLEDGKKLCLDCVSEYSRGW